MAYLYNMRMASSFSPSAKPSSITQLLRHRGQLFWFLVHTVMQLSWKKFLQA
jgi:hypothetical protein